MSAIHRRPRPSGNFELYAWFFMRVSGLALLFLAVFHLLYMHMVIRVDNITFEVVAARWQSPFWRLFDMGLLVFSVLHGTNGTRTVVDDYVPSGIGNVVLKWALYTGAAFILVLGLHVLLTFRAPGGVG